MALGEQPKRKSNITSINSSGRDNFNLGIDAPAPKSTKMYLQGLTDNSLSQGIDALPAPDVTSLFNQRSEKGDELTSNIADKEAKIKALENQKMAAVINTALTSVTNVMSSSTQLEAISGAAATNVYLMNYQKSLIIGAGKQAAMDRQMEGELNADKASLALAAQGQSLNSAGAEKVMASYRAIALENAFREEAAMYAEIAGVDIQIANEHYNVEMAENQNRMALYQGILSTGASIAGAYAGGGDKAAPKK